MAEKSDVPGQVTFPGNASEKFTTDKDGTIYPKENKRTTAEYLSGEGSMGFNRNQGVEREGFQPTEAEGGTMGQHKIQKIKEAGSYAI